MWKRALNKRNECWLGLENCIRAFGVSKPVFCKVYLPLFPPDAIRPGPRGTPEYHLRTLIDLLIDREVRNAAPPVTAEGEPVDMAASNGRETPAQRRWRLLQGDLAELELKKRKRELVAVAEVGQAFDAGANAIRRGVAKLERQFGPAAAAIITAALDEAARLMPGSEQERS